jgi:hypothetical protein
MTKQELNARITELMKDVIPSIRKECKRLATSGAIDFDNDDPESFAAAKKILTVALENVSKQYTPFDKDARKDVANLRNF